MQEAERELLVVAGRAHRDRQRRAVDADLQRLLDGHLVALAVADDAATMRAVAGSCRRRHLTARRPAQRRRHRRLLGDRPDVDGDHLVLRARGVDVGRRADEQVRPRLREVEGREDVARLDPLGHLRRDLDPARRGCAPRPGRRRRSTAARRRRGGSPAWSRSSSSTLPVRRVIVPAL